MSLRRSLANVLAIAAALLASRPAGAYVRAHGTSSNAPPLFWASSVVQLEVTRPPDGFPIDPDDFYAQAAAAVAAWSYPAVDCTSVSLTLAPGFAEGQAVAFDGHSRIITRTGDWCCEPSHLPGQVALTTVFSRSHPGAPDDGEIVEADIELNDVDWMWAMMPDPPPARDYEFFYDMRSALTHEVGHFIGLAHDCVQPGEAARVDDAGNVSPDCSSIPASEDAAIRAATMYALMSPADVSWRSLSDDDARAACDIYPRGTLTVYGWCSVGASRGDASSSLGGMGLFGALAAVGLARRSHRFRRPRS